LARSADKRVGSDDFHFQTLGAAGDGGADVAEAMIAGVFIFRTSMPVYLPLEPCPPFSERWPGGYGGRATIIRPIVCSAAAMVLRWAR